MEEWRSSSGGVALGFEIGIEGEFWGKVEAGGGGRGWMLRFVRRVLVWDVCGEAGIPIIGGHSSGSGTTDTLTVGGAV